MTTSTTDAEAIALLNDFASKYRDGRFHCAMNPTAAQELATAILSLLASRRGEQEPECECPTLEHCDGSCNLPPAPVGEVGRLTPNERFIPRMLLLDDLHAVCIGGHWDGWKFFKHPDGQWVSLEKLKQEGAYVRG